MKNNKPFKCPYCRSIMLKYDEPSSVIKVNFMVSEKHYPVMCDECKRCHVRVKVWWSDDEPALYDCLHI